MDKTDIDFTQPIEGLITQFSVSQSEKRKAVDQFQPNDYYSSVTVQLPRPVRMGITDDLKQLMNLMIGAAGICKINNRASETRDGINPRICNDVPDMVFGPEGNISVNGAVQHGKEKRVLMADLGIKMPVVEAPAIPPASFPTVKPSRKATPKTATPKSQDELPEVRS